KHTTITITITTTTTTKVVDKDGIIVNHDGEPTRRQGIKWSSPPEQLFFAFPYIVSLQAKCIEVHHNVTQKLIERMDIPSCKWAGSVCYQSDSIWRSYGCVAGESNLMSMHLCSLTQQFLALTEPPDRSHFQEALYLCEKIDKRQFFEEDLDVEEKTRRTKELYAYHLFNKAQFQEAVVYFEQAKVSVRRVISLFPAIVPPGQCKNTLQHHPIGSLFANKNESEIKKVCFSPYI
ncbi:hypothetical protein RFI_16264, partial [Reticulomyxa filosa]